MSKILPDYLSCIQRLLTDIGYRYESFPPHDADYWESFHGWMVNVLGPASSWTLAQLAEVEHAAGGISERAYPYAGTELKLLLAKMTALGIVLDDSVEDEAVYAEIVQFSQKLYLGEAQQNPLLALYHATLLEVSDFYGNDAILRGLAVVPWINYLDACLMEKDIFTTEVAKAVNSMFPAYPKASAGTSLGEWSIALRKCRFRGPGSEILNVSSSRCNSPHYLRSKSGAAEAYAAGIFKATKDQNFPVSKYIRVLPDVAFFIEVMNDLLSFHKEELAGETHNLIHLRTRGLSSSGAAGSGLEGQWTTYDTIRVLCDDLREATLRVNGLLRLEECERKTEGFGRRVGEENGVIDETEVALARQWRGWRDGYISWHFECRRYKLESVRGALLPDECDVPT
ncbi:hypothetical protein C8R43DRAFT_1086920 [Mycena crocata]|nr:hypothetical protein C8R43DRAFT_1086920 [Mycena crocata]